MNKSQLLIELPSMLSHIVTKRGRVLRDGGSSGVSTLIKDTSKAWVATSVPSSAKKLPWDEAHEVAAKLKKEFGSAVYVEPEALAGRFHQLTSPSPEQPDEFGTHQNPLVAATSPGPTGFGTGATGFEGMFTHNFDPMAISGVSQRGNSRGSTSFGPGASLGLGSSLDPLAGHMHLGPHIPSAADFLPKEVAQMLGQTEAPAQASLEFAPLHFAEGFSELPEATQKMFEVEAAQLMTSAQSVGINIIDDYSALVALALQPDISKALRKFLEHATAGSKSADKTEGPVEAS